MWVVDKYIDYVKEQTIEDPRMSFVADALCQPDSYVWGNIFSPCALIRCFGLKTLSIECLSCLL